MCSPHRDLHAKQLNRKPAQALELIALCRNKPRTPWHAGGQRGVHLVGYCRVWSLLQLVDSAFPSGGFVHSSGLEAASALGFVKSRDDLQAFARETIWQTAFGAVPFLSLTYETSFAKCDDDNDAFLWSSVTRHASETQGRALLLAAARVFDADHVTNAAARVRSKESRGHYAPVFGLVAMALGIAKDDARRAFLFSSLRNVLSAGVRLGLLGPFEAQRMHVALTPTLEAADIESATLQSAALVTPLIELVQSEHTRLGVRLFQS